MKWPDYTKQTCVNHFPTVAAGEVKDKEYGHRYLCEDCLNKYDRLYFKPLRDAAYIKYIAGPRQPKQGKLL